MKVIFRPLNIPAANRYTKVAPTVSAVALILHFYNFLKKVLSRCVKGMPDDDSVSNVLTNDNAVVGIPDDAMVHMRKVNEAQRLKMSRLVP